MASKGFAGSTALLSGLAIVMAGILATAAANAAERGAHAPSAARTRRAAEPRVTPSMHGRKTAARGTTK